MFKLSTNNVNEIARLTNFPESFEYFNIYVSTEINVNKQILHIDPLLNIVLLILFLGMI